MSRVRRAVTFAVAASAATASSLLLLSTPAAAEEPACVALVLCPAPGEEPAQPEPEPEPAPTPPAEPKAQPTPAEATAELLALLNRERRAHGLPLLTRRGDVDGIATSWSRRIADDGELSHNDDYFTAETRRRLDAKALGENVARNQSPEAAHAALMNSPGHRANILDRRFLVVGLGAVHAHGSWWITQNFLEPRAARPAAAAASAPPPSRPPGAATAAPALRRAAATAPTVAGRTAAPVVVPVAASPAADRPVAAPSAPRPDVLALAARPPSISPVEVPDPGTPYRAATIAAVCALAGFACSVAAEHRRRRWLAAEGSPLAALRAA